MEAMFYRKYKDMVQCVLCPQNCYIQEGKRGACGVRQNNQGRLISLVYGKQLTYQIDPIEKKPLFHFRPGTPIYSFATAGCNFHCNFCQNWQISQLREVSGDEKGPDDIIREAKNHGCYSIAMTYVEPTIFYEYALNTCKKAKSEGLSTVFVSNGYINAEPLKELTPYLDAINIDLKSFDDTFYKEICGARLQPVLDSIRRYHEEGVWLEITTLVIPGQNDSEDELRKIAEFIASIDKDIPWHISRFHPDYKMRSTPITTYESLELAYRIGRRAGLNYIYVGNVPGHRESTYCPQCSTILINRHGFAIVENNLNNGHCAKCNNKIAGVW